MREIDEVRITLLRLFRGAVQLPQEIIDEMLKAFLHTQDAAIKVQAYGRGLLQRFRYHRLNTKDFNRQASREYQEYLKYRLPHNWLELHEHPNGFSEGDARFYINEDYDGISAKWHTRAHRESRKALAYRIRPPTIYQDKFSAPYRMHGVFGWLQGRFTRFVKMRLNWRAHRSRLGVKLLDFSSN